MGMFSHHAMMIGGSVTWPAAFSGWGRRVKITIQSGQVAETLTNYPLYIRMSDLPASAFSNMQSAGQDLRATKADGETELPIEPVTVTTGSSVGELHIEVDSVSSSSDTVIYIYYDNSGASAYAVGDTYGRNAVWATYRAVYHMQESNPGSDSIIDATGNGYNMADIGSMVSGDSVAGKLEGNGIQFERSKSQGLFINGHFFSGSPVYPFTVEQLIFTASGESTNQTSWGLAVGGSSTINYRDVCVNASSGEARIHARNTTEIQAAGSTDLRNAWHSITDRYRSATDRVLLVDGVSEATSTTSVLLSGSVNRMSIGYVNDLTPGGYTSAKIDESRWSEVDRSTNWCLAQWINMNTPATFYTVSPEETP